MQLQSILNSLHLRIIAISIVLLDALDDAVLSIIFSTKITLHSTRTYSMIAVLPKANFT